MAEFQNRWVSHLRNSTRKASVDRSLSCALCAADIQPDIDAFRAHVRADEPKHSALTGDADIEEAFKKMTLLGSKKKPATSPSKSALPNSPQRSRKRTGPKLVDESSSPPTTPARSRRYSNIASDFDRGETSKNNAGRKLWSPADEAKIRSSHARSSTQRHPKHANKSPLVDDDDPVPVHPADLTTLPNFAPFRQPETKPINQSQLVSELKSIYEALRLVETKCIELDDPTKSTIPASQQLSLKQYQKLIGLHCALLHEHYDFFLASQHPVAHAALRHLPAKYGMPARMWRHGIQSFLEFLRKRLPASIEHMLTFIYVAYSIMTLLYETVHDYAETWIECLGDLGRYRMAVEDDDIRDREIWASVSRYWYSKASSTLSTVGRLYHHLAILARPDALQQLYYYSKSLCVPVPFISAWDSSMTLFDPILRSNSTRLDACDAAFVRVQGILFSAKCRHLLQSSADEFLGSIDKRIAIMNKEWRHPGFYIAISLICSMLGYGLRENPLMRALPRPDSSTTGVPSQTPLSDAKTRLKIAVNAETAAWAFDNATSFAMQSCDMIMQRKSDVNILPFLHTMMVFLYHVAQHPKAMSLVETKIPWKRTAELLNEMMTALISTPRMAAEGFPRPPPREPLRPLPEDYAMRGLLLSKDYFPVDWFSSDQLEEDEKMFEPPSLADERRQRVLWLGRRIGSLGRWMEWDEGEAKFTVDCAFNKDLNLCAGLG